MYISLVYIIMLIRLLEVPSSWAGFATPLVTFKDDYDELEPSTSTTSYIHHHISGGRVAPHATQASTSGGFASVHAAQAQPASAGATSRRRARVRRCAAPRRVRGAICATAAFSIRMISLRR